MTDNELLLALSNLFDKKLKPIESRLDKIELRLDKIEARLDSVESRLDSVESRLDTIELVLENDIRPRLNTIEACYTSTFNRYKNSVDSYEAMESDIDIMKKVITEHSIKLQKLARTYKKESAFG